MSERLNRAWIETKLSLRERNSLFDAILEETSAPTGEQILAKIAELFPKKKESAFRPRNKQMEGQPLGIRRFAL